MGQEGRSEMGVYVVILRRTPDHEDLVTTTDSEVLCRVVGRWVGQGGKTSLIKVKAHRGDPLNEGGDDLGEAGREIEKEGENSRWRGSDGEGQRESTQAGEGGLAHGR